MEAQSIPAVQEREGNKPLSTPTVVATGKAVQNQNGGIPTPVIRTPWPAPGAVINCATDQTPTGMLMGQPQEARGGGQPSRAENFGGPEGNIKHWRICPAVKEEPEEATAQIWETQWKEFLTTVEVSPPRLEAPQFLREPAPWDDTPAFLASFEQVAKAYQWPEEEWADRLLPTLKGEAELAFSSLEDGEKEDYGKVKAAILRQDTLNQEKSRQCFRHFSYKDATGPREAYDQLQEFCRQWLKVERNSKEQILELLILEQFLTVLPPEIQSWVKQHNFESSLQAVSLAEDFLQRWRARVKEEQAAELREEGSVHSSEVEGAHLDTGLRSSPSLEAEMEEDTDFSDADWSDSGEMHGDEEKLPQEISKQIQGTPPEKVNFRHEKIPTGEKPYICFNCDEGFITRVSLEEHQKHHAEKNSSVPPPEVSVYMCSECEESFDSILDLEAHQIIHRGKKTYVCSECGKKFGQEQDLRKHQETHATAKLFKCSDCGEGFAWLSSYNRHRKIHSGVMVGSESEIFPCSKCGKTFPTTWRLKRHQRTHSTKNPYQCADCGERFMWSVLLYRHEKKMHHGKKQAPPQKVSSTEEGTHKRSEHGKSQHERKVHTGERPYKCVDCGESFTLSLSLEKHRKNHKKQECVQKRVFGSQKKHQCSECGRNFDRPSRLVRHQLIHTGKQLHRCTDCGACFRWSVSLDRHRKRSQECKKVSINKNKTSCVCSECGKTFSKPSSQLRHQRVHTRANSYLCTDCGQRYLWKESLVVHQKRIHKGRKLVPLLQKITSLRGKLSPWPKLEEKTNQAVHDIRHPETHADETPYTCAEPGESFTSHLSHTKGSKGKKQEPSLKSISVADKKGHTCSECGKNFKSPSLLRRHHRVHTGEKVYECPICKERFMWGSTLNRHRKKVHKGMKKIHDGKEKIHDGKKKIHDGKEKIHDGKEKIHDGKEKIHDGKEKIHDGKEKIHDGKEKIHDGKEKIHDGKEKIHDGKEKIHDRNKSFVCLECGKNFYYPSRLKKHQRIHTREKTYKSVDAGERFLSSSPERYGKDGESEKPRDLVKKKSGGLVCSDCGVRFTRASNLKIHQHVHSGKKPYQCSDCGERFMWNAGLYAHKKKTGHGKKSARLTQRMPDNGEERHHGYKDEESFGRRSEVLRLQCTLSRKTSHTCSECGKTFYRRSHLRRHQKIHVRAKFLKYAYREDEKKCIPVEGCEKSESPPSGLQQILIQVLEEKPLQLLNQQDECELNSAKQDDLKSE